MNHRNDTTTRPNSRPLSIVAIGASAGGLEALEQLFAHMPSDLGMSYVIIQHLSPHYKSFMAELLSRHTAMRVRTAEHHMLLEADTVYLLPPKKQMAVSRGRLILTEPDPAGGISMPIDSFFESLAQAPECRSVGVMLSGSGQDGTVGITALKEAGGLVLIQDEASAKYAAMPKNAAMTGLADYVLTPMEMGARLREHVQSGFFRQPSDPTAVKKKGTDVKEHQLSVIMALLRGATGIDFSSYKPGSVQRRIERRVGICGLKSIREYIDYIHSHPEELALLHKDLLIGVTHFFRDPDAFEALQNQVLPQLMKNKGDHHEIRVWVAGCSTGEEAYSLAIMFREYMEQLDMYFDVKIFATDLDKDSIEFACLGLYSAKLVESIPEDILAKYFIRIQEKYQVHKDIRKMIVFAPHNVLKDPPFINLDLITCRNMLIYLQSEMQRKVISLFHFALNANGYLFLGPSETVGKLSGLFQAVEKKWNIFRYKETKRTNLTGALGLGGGGDSRYASKRPKFSKLPEAKAVQPLDSVMNALVKECLPPCIVIDEQNEVLFTSGDTGDYMKIPEGKPSNDVLKLVAPGISTVIGSAIHKVRKEKSEVRYGNLQAETLRGVRNIVLRVKPIPRDTGERHLALFFEEQDTHSDAAAAESDPCELRQDVRQRIQDLEQELSHAEEYLQATIEELETSNEELQATNEELIAANEEMQSTNEELQSLNEELVTVNNEHQSKIQELTELNNDLDNLLTSTKIATVFLDSKMCIRRFTPSITSEINLLDVDIGRPLSHISHHFKYGSIVKDAQRVVRTHAPLEKEIQSRGGNWYIMRILPYWINERFVDGVVITFVDITELKLANENMRLLSHAIEQSPSTIVIADPKGNVEYVNPKFTENTGFTLAEVQGKHLRWMNRVSQEVSRDIWNTVSAGEKWEGELENRTKGGDSYWEHIAVIPIKDSAGEIIHYLQVAENISERKMAEEALRKSEMLSAIGQLAAGIAHEIRNPLTALKGFTKLMGAQTKSSRYTDIMSDELDRIETIISELLVLAKPQAVQYREKDLVTMLEEVIMLLDTQAIMNNVEIVSSMKPEACTVQCIDNQLKQVFINILKNAIEAMPGGGQIRVVLEQQEDGYAVATFTDEGVGIPPEKLQQLGQPFYTTKEKGTGLGLMMTYKIVENHKGSMHVASKVGEGTTVTVKVPLLNKEFEI